MGNTLQKPPQNPAPPSQGEQQLDDEEDENQTFKQLDDEEDENQTFKQLDDEEDENQTFTCEICIEPTRKRFTNSDICSHPFCSDCVVKYIRTRLEDSNAGRIICPSPTCDHALDPLACVPLVGPELFARWCDVLCEAAVVGLDTCYCPHANCSALIVNECGEGVKKSQCPGCKRWFCFGCKMVWHAGFACEESGEQRDRNDVAFGWLAERSRWVTCPQCRHFVERTGGCSTVMCRCGMSFCYGCGKQFVRNSTCGCLTAPMIQELRWHVLLRLVGLLVGLYSLIILAIIGLKLFVSGISDYI